jgi:hypothetical protein
MIDFIRLVVGFGLAKPEKFSAKSADVTKFKLSFCRAFTLHLPSLEI